VKLLHFSLEWIMKPSNCSGAAAILSDSLVFCFLMGDPSRISQTGTVSTFVVEVELVQREILLVDVRTFGVCVGGAWTSLRILVTSPANFRRMPLYDLNFGDKSCHYRLLEGQEATPMGIWNRHSINCHLHLKIHDIKTCGMRE
jgi:hypothetical protein